MSLYKFDFCESELDNRIHVRKSSVHEASVNLISLENARTWREGVGQVLVSSTRDDHIIRGRVSRSSTASCKKIRQTLAAKDFEVSLSLLWDVWPKISLTNLLGNLGLHRIWKRNTDFRKIRNIKTTEEWGIIFRWVNHPAIYCLC